MPLDAAYDWVDVIVGFDDFMARRRFANDSPTRTASSSSRSRAVAAPVPYDYFKRHQKFLRREQSVVLLMVAPHAHRCLPRPSPRAARARSSFAPTRRARPRRRACRRSTSSPGTTRRCAAIRVDPTITYLQVLYPFPTHLDTSSAMTATASATKCPAHLEFIRFDGTIACTGLPLVRFTTEARLDEIMPHPRGQWLPDLQPAPLHARGGRHEADRRGPARLQARGRPARACSIRAR